MMFKTNLAILKKLENCRKRPDFGDLSMLKWPGSKMLKNQCAHTNVRKNVQFSQAFNTLHNFFIIKLKYFSTLKTKVKYFQH